MGICISNESSDTQETKKSSGNAIFGEETLWFNKIPSLASLQSQQGNKGPNQDAALLFQGFMMEEGVLCGVFDGHGKYGHIASKLVRNCLPSLLLSQLSPLSSLNVNLEESLDSDEMGLGHVFDEWRRAFSCAFKVMDKELKLQESLDCSFSGTTAVIIIKQDHDLVIANLGDSRAVLGTVSDNGELISVQLTTDLKPGLPKEAERIRNSNGRVFAHKDEPHIQRVWLPNEDSPGLAMARAFGNFQLKNHGIISTPEVSFRRLNNRNQFLVLATDGVWDVLSNKEVAEIVWLSESEEAAGKAVIDAAVAAWGSKFPSTRMDDCTVICLFLQEKHHLLEVQQSVTLTK